MLRLLSAIGCFVCCAASMNAHAQQVTLAGQIINVDASPAPKATVTLYDIKLPFAQHRTTTSGVDGRFEFPDIAKADLSRLGIRATSHDGQTCGIIGRSTMAPDGVMCEVKLQLEVAWRFHLDVTDEDNKPVDSAFAFVGLPNFEFYQAKTNADGRAEYALPRSMQVESVAALKELVGLDFHTFKPAQFRGDAVGKSPLRYPDDVAEKLVLKKARPLAIQIVDDESLPVRGAEVAPSVFQLKGEPGLLSLPSGATRQVTDDKGMVTFNWIPANQNNLYFSVDAEPNYVSVFRSVKLNEEPITIAMERPAIIRGQVTDAQGQPKADIEVVGNGITYEDSYRATTNTDNEGKYELRVKPNGAYIVTVVDKQLTAPAQDGIVVPRGSAINSINFQLIQPTRFAGQMLDVFTRKPVANEKIRLVKKARSLTAEELALLNKPATVTRRELRPDVSVEATTDTNGRFEFLAAPGEYSVEYLDQRREQTIGQTPLDIALPAKVKTLSTFSGVVINKATGEPLAKATVHDTGYGATWQATTDAAGKFTVQRSLDDAFLIAFTKDKALVGIANVPPGDTEVRIECLPTGSVHGKLVSVSGQPLANQQVEYQMPMRSRFSSLTGAFGKSVQTDERGEFTIKPVFAGHDYFLGTPGTAGRMNQLTKFKIEPGQTLDLGTIRE